MMLHYKYTDAETHVILGKRLSVAAVCLFPFLARLR